MKLLLVSGLATVLLTGSAGAVALVAGPPEDAEIPDQVTLPELPAQVPDEVPVPDDAEPPVTDGEPTSEVGRERRETALAFAGAMQGWADCVAAAAAAHGGSTGPFDPTAACGPKPTLPGPAQAGQPDGGAPAEVSPPVTPPVAPPSVSNDPPRSGEDGQELGEDMAEQGQAVGDAGASNAPIDVPTGRP